METNKNEMELVWNMKTLKPFIFFGYKSIAFRRGIPEKRIKKTLLLGKYLNWKLHVIDVYRKKGGQCGKHKKAKVFFCGILTPYRVLDINWM